MTDSEYFKDENLFHVRTRGGRLGKLCRPVTVWQETRRRLKRERYDFVYGMSEGAHPGVCAAAHMGIPCALRQFGTQEMANVLEPIGSRLKRWMTALKDYPYITLSLLSRKTFLLGTNDGSRSDELFDMLGLKRRPFDYYFWRSGVFVPSEQPAADLTGDHPAGAYPDVYNPWSLSHIGRVADVKRQDRSVRILGELHRRGYPFHLYFVGEISGQAMYDEARRLAEEYGVADYVHYEGSQPQNVCRRYARNAAATLLPGEWNRVNIFYEVMGEGAVVVTNNNHSIDEFIEDGVNCVVYETEAEAAERLINLLEQPEQQKRIRANAYQTAAEQFLTLEQRFGMEVQLVLDRAGGRDTAYPGSV